ncbi:MAG: hypothetical protein JSV85_06375 [Candidatus Bathyarchaeota archaeon]|nr:MAG: hypothetical protein JSV85_06375 [Candidatus Bathyarchaeota archaeon]
MFSLEERQGSLPNAITSSIIANEWIRKRNKIILCRIAIAYTAVTQKLLVDTKMENQTFFHKMEELIASDKNLVATLISFAAVFLIFANLYFFRSPILGALLTIAYFLVNAVFMGQIFFQKESPFLRLMLGILSLIAIVGLVSWATMTIHNLDNTSTTVALFVVAATTSVINRFKGNRLNRVKSESPASESSSLPLHGLKVLYLLLVTLLLRLLFMGRSDEIYTVWQYLSPVFLPLYFITTFLLLRIIFSTEQTKYKLLFVIVHSILSRSFFLIIFPVGDIGGSQLVLGRTRLIFDNVIMNGWPPWPVTGVLERIYHAFRGLNFQTAFSVTFARMFGVDVYWTHRFLIPILWGTFVPIAAFMTAKALGANEKISVLASLLVSLFPATIVWGTYSVPNSLGYIFFASAVPFFLKYLSSTKTRTLILMLAFSFASFLGHALTGIISFSLVLLAWALKRYEDEKYSTLKTARAFLFTTFTFSTSLMPFALVYLKYFYPIDTYFSLARLYEIPASEFVILLLFGQTVEFELSTALIFVAAPLAGLLSMIYILYSVRKYWSNRPYRVGVVFLFLGILMFLAQHRFLNLFMTNIPFPGGRLWMFRDFMAVPLVAIFVYATISYLHHKTSNALNQLQLPQKNCSIRLNSKMRKYASASVLLIMYLSAFILISGWITVSIHRAYPHFAPMQTTTYELDAARHIDQTTEERYIVICDQWFIYAAEMVVGVYNPNAYYFTSLDPKGVSLFLEMRREPTEATMIKAMEHNNASVAYFVIEKLRLGEDEYNRTKSQALQNGLQIYPEGIYFYPEEVEKLCIFYYEES